MLHFPILSRSKNQSYKNVQREEDIPYWKYYLSMESVYRLWDSEWIVHFDSYTGLQGRVHLKSGLSEEITFSSFLLLTINFPRPTSAPQLPRNALRIWTN